MDPAKEIRETLDFWRLVAQTSLSEHPSHVVVRVLEGLLRRIEGR